MKKLIVFMLVGLVCLVGCTPSGMQASPPSSNSTPKVVFTETPKKISIGLDAAPEDMTWMAPGKVHIKNLYTGAQAEWLITVHNGEQEARDFVVKPRIPDYTDEKYEEFTKEMLDWVSVSSPRVTLRARETLDILVTVTRPIRDEQAHQNFEVWISVMDDSQTSMVRTELCSRWLISTGK